MFQQGLEGFGSECLLMAGKVVEAVKVKTPRNLWSSGEIDAQVFKYNAIEGITI